MRAGPVRPPALHSIYIMRPPRAFALLVGAELIELASEALWMSSSRAALFLLGDFGIDPLFETPTGILALCWAGKIFDGLFQVVEVFLDSLHVRGEGGDDRGDLVSKCCELGGRIDANEMAVSAGEHGHAVNGGALQHGGFAAGSGTFHGEFVAEE